MIQTINPANEKEWLELRTKDVTSSEIAALFNISPYMTEFELWHRKKEGNVVVIEQNDPMKWGSRLQDSIAAGIAEDEGWEIRKMTEYVRDDELRIGSSFDFSIEEIVSKKEGMGALGVGTMIETVGAGILEIKNVFGMIYKDQWLENDDGTVEAPPHIEIQVQHQLLVSGRAFAYIAALIGGNKIVLIRREPDTDVIEAIKKKVKKFWESIDANTPPKPNFAIDAEFISKLYGFADPGKVLETHDKDVISLAFKHKSFADAEKAAKESKDAIKAELLMKFGDCEKVICDGFTVTLGTVAPADISYHRDGYRMFRINWPRGKKA